MRTLVFILMLSFPFLCNAGEVYKWRDKDGNIHYSDVEPPKQTVQRKVVKNKNAKALTPAEQAAKAKADKVAAQKAQCDQSKQNVATISDAKYTTISLDVDNDGKPDVLTPEQRAAQTERMKAIVTVNCTQ
jgi:membrane-bound lytic murein transglycosylase